MMNQFSPDADAWAPESTEIPPSGSSVNRPLLALGAAGSALLLTVAAWVLLPGGDETQLNATSPVAADPFVSAAPPTPGPSGTPTDAATASSLDQAAGRDPFVPLIVLPVAASPAGVVTGGTPSVTPTPTATPTPVLTPAPAGKKKPVPTTGPVL